MDISQRDNISFAQAEGLAPLPSQLRLRELSPAMRSRLWADVHFHLELRDHNPYHLDNLVFQVLRDWFVDERHGFVDDVSPRRDHWVKTLRPIFEDGSYADVLGLIQYWVRHKSASYLFVQQVERALISTGSAYRLLNRWTIAPISSEENAEALSVALSAVAGSGSAGAKAHLESAAAALNRNDYPGSVRESIHAVDAAARMLAPDSKDLGPSLTALAESGYIHGAMKSAFSALYGYTSDEKGVRHSLLFSAEAKVDEEDALFMFGACASFCAYLVRKGQQLKLI